MEQHPERGSRGRAWAFAAAATSVIAVVVLALVVRGADNTSSVTEDEFDDDGITSDSMGQVAPVVASSPTTSLVTDVIATDVIGVVPSPGWSRVPDPPLMPRVGAAVFEIGFDVFVMGGRDPACDVAAGDCTRYTDGAAFDLASHTWRVIADAPVAFDESMTGDAGVVVPVLTTATGADAAEAGDRRLLLYDTVRDSWSVVDGLPADAGTEVRPAGEGVLIYHRRSDETARQPDYLYSRRTQEWTALPPTLLPPSAERWFFSDGALLCLFATPVEPTSATTSPTVVTKCLDTGYGEWRGATDSTRTGSDLWRMGDGRVVLVPSGAAGADGGVFDLRSGQWTALPPPPDDPAWPTTIAGAADLGATAVFVRANGWVLDLQTGWFLVPPFDDREAAHATSVARGIFVFGGRRVAADGTIEHLADAWIWTPSP